MRERKSRPVLVGIGYYERLRRRAFEERKTMTRLLGEAIEAAFGPLDDACGLKEGVGAKKARLNKIPGGA